MFVHLQHLINDVSVVGQSWHLVLSAELALRFEPVVEQPIPCHHHLEVLQGDVVETLCLIVGVDLLQTLVEHVGKMFYRIGHLRKLDDPLVSALCVLVHEHRRGGIFLDLGSRLAASLLQTLLGVVLYQLLAEGVDEIFCSACDNKLIRVARGEHHGVADHVAPQSARRAYDHGVVLVQLHACERHNGGVALAHLFEGYELVEHVIVEHEQHRLVRRVVLYAEEALGGVVGLHVAHLWRGDQLLIL